MLGGLLGVTALCPCATLARSGLVPEAARSLEADPSNQVAPDLALLKGKQ